MLGQQRMVNTQAAFSNLPSALLNRSAEVAQLRFAPATTCCTFSGIQRECASNPQMLSARASAAARGGRLPATSTAAASTLVCTTGSSSAVYGGSTSVMHRRFSKTLAASTTSPSTPTTLEDAKARLLEACSLTQRGSQASRMQRGQVEEAQVQVESFATTEADWKLLEGTWWVQYTTASDVRPLVQPPPPGPIPLRVGRVGQRFSSPEQGRVQNLIEIQLDAPIIGGSRATLVVDASYECRTARSIALRFEAAGVSDVYLSDGFQNFLAPPLLPRGWWNLALLQALEAAAIRIPLVTRLPGMSSSSRTPVGINYSITYLDEDLLIGRASNGTYIYTRDTSAN